MPVEGTKYSALPAAESIHGLNELGVNQFGISRKITLHQIWSGGLGGLTQGAIPFAGPGGVPTQDASNLFWDNTNKRLGIRTTSPESKLHVRSTTDPAVQPALILVDHYQDGSGDEVAGIGFRAGNTPQVGVKTAVAQARENNSYGRGALVFLQRNVADGTSVTMSDEVMRIMPSGNVGIGTTNPGFQLHLSQDSAAKPSTNTWTVSSDRRLKINIQDADLQRCYEIVRSIPLHYYRWRDEVYSSEQVQDRGKLGWIADEVQAVFPKAVNKTEFACPPVEDGIEEYDEPVMEEVPVEQTSIEIINGVPTQVTKTVTQSRPVVDYVPVVDAEGQPVMQADGTPLLHPVPRTRKATRPKVRRDVIQDCLSLNADQLYAAMYGAIQFLAQKVEQLESRLS